MEITISTPALLFPAITLLLLAYTNRFLAIATLIRGLHKNYRDNPSNDIISEQILNLKKRLAMIKMMQLFGILSLFLCVISMFTFYLGIIKYGGLGFGASLLSMMVSLVYCLREIYISTEALKLELSNMEV